MRVCRGPWNDFGMSLEVQACFSCLSDGDLGRHFRLMVCFYLQVFKQYISHMERDKTIPIVMVILLYCLFLFISDFLYLFLARSENRL